MEKGIWKFSLYNLGSREEGGVLCAALIKHLLCAAATEQLLDRFQVQVRTGDPGSRSALREEPIDMQLTV